MNRIVLMMLAVGLLGAACSSHGGSQEPSSSIGAGGEAAPPTTAPTKKAPVPDPIQGCVPSCNEPGISQPGQIAKGPYETQWFFGGEMVITLDEPWSVREDSTGEFHLTLDAAPVNDVLFWEDVYPIERGKRVRDVSMTVKGLLGWLRNNPRLDVSAPRPGTIGSDLPATVVDVTVAKGAKNEDPNCPTDTCILWLGYPQWDGNFGIAEPQVQHFYLSDVSYGGRTHLFIAVVYPDDPRDMKKYLPHGEDLIATVQVPATPA
jgi:hypothetical protein